MFCKVGNVTFFSLCIRIFTDFQMGKREREDDSVYKNMLIYLLLTVTLFCWAFPELSATFQSQSRLGEKQKNDKKRKEKKGRQTMSTLKKWTLSQVGILSQLGKKEKKFE